MSEVDQNEKLNESRILSNKVAGFSAACRNGQDAPCTGSCPYGLDIRSFIQRVRRGSMRGAYNILSDSLLFPETLCSICGHACKNACAAEMEGAPVDLPSIERSVIENAPRRGVQKFRVPPKEERIAVVGAGLSGMAAAYTLGSVGYPVTIFEKEEAPGGSLAGALSEDIYLPELNSVLEASNIELITGREISDLSELEDFSGVIVATGKGGNDLGILKGRQGFACEAAAFAIGELTGAAVTSSVSFGKAAGTAMDRFLKAAESPRIQEMPAPGSQPLSVTTDISTMSRDEASAEALRCRMCDCTRCADVCEFMRYYKKLPPRFEIDIPGTLNPVELVRKRSATRVLMSCDDCRLCEKVCPEHINTGEILMQVRTAMAHDRVLPAAFHDFWMRDMAFSCSEEASYLKKPENGYLFFPGCLLGASDPENVTGSFDLLNKLLPGCGIWLHCCGIPAKWAGETAILDNTAGKIRQVWEECGRPVFITACPSCKRNLKEFVPDIHVESVYTILAGHSDEFSPSMLAGEELTVFHPCSSLDDPAEQESVKALITACGGNVRELSDPADRNGCCGYGGHIFYTNPALYDSISKRRAAADELPYIAYCANCRDVLADKGKDSTHILNILAKGRRISSPAPTLTARRSNRKQLKYALQGVQPEENEMNLKISSELAHSMDRQLILNSDVEAVIQSCEDSKRYLITEEGAFIGHLKLGMVTYWVTWKKEGDLYTILNVYSHRMVIEGE